MLNRPPVHQVNLDSLFPILCCPRCKTSLDRTAEAWRCGNSSCHYYDSGFPLVDGTPVLIDFENSVFDEAAFTRRKGQSALKRDPSRKSIVSRFRDFLMGSEKLERGHSERFAAALDPGARVLVIGGGEKGAGTAALYNSPEIAVIGTDVYVSTLVSVVSDAHRLPFVDESVEGVWIQAVLEHVLEPHVVTAEIERVLKPGGVVYAGTPFMQQVHEGAYDFTRFTHSGHRWLFRKFDEIEAGVIGGPGKALVWSLRYFVRSLTGSNKVATASMVFYFWIRYFDRFGFLRQSADAACGVYFIDRKSQHALQPRDIVEYYTAARIRSPYKSPQG